MLLGVLEANFVEPAHDKQGFERTTVLARLEGRLIQMQKNYWYFCGVLRKLFLYPSIVPPNLFFTNFYTLDFIGTQIAIELVTLLLITRKQQTFLPAEVCKNLGFDWIWWSAQSFLAPFLLARGSSRWRQ